MKSRNSTLILTLSAQTTGMSEFWAKTLTTEAVKKSSMIALKMPKKIIKTHTRMMLTKMVMGQTSVKST
jgi:hypothetical protein